MRPGELRTGKFEVESQLALTVPKEGSVENGAHWLAYPNWQSLLPGRGLIAFRGSVAQETQETRPQIQPRVPVAVVVGNAYLIILPLTLDTCKRNATTAGMSLSLGFGLRLSFAFAFALPHSAYDMLYKSCFKISLIFFLVLFFLPLARCVCKCVCL